MHDRTKKDSAKKKPRGRPRAYEPEVALRAAADAFWKGGYSGTSLDDIAAATGMNRPSLRAAFGDKHAIYIKALSDYWELKCAAMREALDGGGALDEALMRVYDAALSIYFSGADRARGCFVVGTAVTEAVDDAEIRSLVATGLRTLDAGFEARLRLAREAGELRKDADPEALAMLASATMHTMAIRARAGTSRRDLRRLARKAVSMICG
ncbi:TetR/AcrR family transcriptional regulator [Rhodanobacter glycinis]|uniref:TetR/AcrR family transcriptional regulator n=1 Tax=Rhodanobacter glycinis TaxID=582702 RepID=A0A502BVL8_9GAMM|nr:TetR/AcrR family transcriptional regulator [Rhodanobacter glycinis]TPG04512.1 TetR/AcrR family transcriptional regulator [Rhodanobacter glycinis]TPG49952.1 TetR/AcrR family transcriptional regulator [Rhodanobacter glycinis]